MNGDWDWAGPPLDTQPLFPLERAEFLGLLRDLEAADWQRPTACPGWRVHEVVAHVVHDYIRKLSGLRDQHTAPGPLPAESLPGFLHRVNQEFVDAAHRWSPRVLTDLLVHLGPQLDEMWASLDLRRTGEAVSWAAPGRPAPVWLDVAREYTEYWVHQQQVRDAVGRPGADDERLAAAVTDTFLRAVPHALRHVFPGTGDLRAHRRDRPGRWRLDDRAPVRHLGSGPGLACGACHCARPALVRMPVAGGDPGHHGGGCASADGCLGRSGPRIGCAESGGHHPLTRMARIIPQAAGAFLEP